ncbi:hypothetical protein [Streptomyces sp. G-5]|uniref:hypothetical protein n=1 Tax=Streptomyces sp. G-5 TaxID=2977231 RepID=UPI0021CF1963|nr:hypothetical protein [Streptomyces sp. G-5]MCU4750065.1 hypothetical protein [Streptomyces sp. G-5]
MSESSLGPQAQSSATASGERAVAAEGSITTAVTGDGNVVIAGDVNVINCYMIFGGTEKDGPGPAAVAAMPQPLAAARGRVIVPVLVGIVN